MPANTSPTAENGCYLHHRLWNAALYVLTPVAIFGLAWSAIIVMLFLAMFVGGIVSWGYREYLDAHDQPVTGRDVGPGAAAAGATLFCSGLIAGLGGWGFWLALGLIVGSPTIAPHVLRKLGAPEHILSPETSTQADQPSPTPPRNSMANRHFVYVPECDPDLTPSDLTAISRLYRPLIAEPSDCAAMTDDDLCLAWRRSFLHLQTATPAGRMRVVERRQSYLDEMHRRNSIGATSWLTAGARAAGDPTRFIARIPQQSHRPPQDRP